MFPRFDRFATLYLARPLISMAGNDSNRHLPILMYHSISDTPEKNVKPYYRVSTSPRAFETQLASLAEQGFKTVKLSEGRQLLASGSDLTKRFTITFDDGFRDFHTAALPILQKFGFTATMFVPTAFISDERKCFKGRECLTWSEVRELRAAGMQFGSHTVNHPKLVELQFSQVRAELHDSRQTLEHELQEQIVTFAYPYAFPQANSEFSSKFTEILQSVGYQVCTTTEVGRVSAADNALRWKRLPVNACDDPAFLKAKVMGAYDWFHLPQSIWKRYKAARGATGLKPVLN
jgi:peptidoglycan/xylan/chitin deacetylase (PgdA/CDA1 family)